MESFDAARSHWFYEPQRFILRRSKLWRNHSPFRSEQSFHHSRRFLRKQHNLVSRGANSRLAESLLIRRQSQQTRSLQSELIIGCHHYSERNLNPLRVIAPKALLLVLQTVRSIARTIIMEKSLFVQVSRVTRCKGHSG